MIFLSQRPTSAGVAIDFRARRVIEGAALFRGPIHILMPRKLINPDGDGLIARGRHSAAFLSRHDGKAKVASDPRRSKVHGG